MFDAEITAAATRLLDACKAAGVTVATAESCTGGLIAGALTEIAGSSAVVDRGFVTYSNEAKAAILGVPPAMIDAHGAVSEEVAKAMAEGALTASQVALTVAVTGVAGPGGSEHKPAGLVHFALARRDGATIAEVHRFGDRGRDAVRLASVATALDLLSQGVDFFG